MDLISKDGRVRGKDPPGATPLDINSAMLYYS
jgi:hypothetical protein